MRPVFTRWEIPPSVSLSALLPDGLSTCGVYVLEFACGELCVGQTISLVNRIATHRRHFSDRIVAVLFAPLPKPLLDQAERDTIAWFVAEGRRLRNIDLVTLPLRQDALEPLMTDVEQHSWLAGESLNFSLGERTIDERQRQRTAAKYRELTQHPVYPAIVEAMAAYVCRCVPLPHLTERSFWSVTSLPATPSGKAKRLAALTINNVEVLVFLRDGKGPQSTVYGFVNIALYSRVSLSARRSTTFEAYQSVGEVQQVHFHDVASLRHVLDSGSAARTLAMGLLRKGRGMMARFHDYNLADEIFAELGRGDECQK